jgi:hypothetical protein
MSTKFGTQEPFTVLVAHFTGQKDANGNPVKARTGFQMQHLLDDQGRVTNVFSAGLPTESSAQVTVSNADFSTGEAILWIGDFEIETNVHWTPTGGDATQSATDLAVAIDALPGLAAVAIGAIVSIDGPMGPSGQAWPFRAAYTGTITNYTLSPVNGYMQGGNPTIGAAGGILP